MKTIALPLLTTIFFAAASVAQQPSDRAEIERIERQLATTADPARLAAFYAPGAIPVLYEGIAPGIYRGNAAIVKAYAAQMVGLQSLEAQIIESTIDVSGDLATAFAVLRVTASTADGQHRSATFRETDIFKRINGRWLIVHQHTSYPVDPLTGKALFDLPPPSTETAH
ncbi:nuclear transport factor 2 family protein [Pseudomonas fluorescens]|nr:nuclear transport factor 2 family protein [Pseudomonas fluorescens]